MEKEGPSPAKVITRICAFEALLPYTSFTCAATTFSKSPQKKCSSTQKFCLLYTARKISPPKWYMRPHFPLYSKYFNLCHQLSKTTSQQEPLRGKDSACWPLLGSSCIWYESGVDDLLLCVRIHICIWIHIHMYICMHTFNTTLVTYEGKNRKDWEVFFWGGIRKTSELAGLKRHLK